MPGFDRASRAAELIWARAEVREARPVGLVVLALLALLSATHPDREDVGWVVLMGGTLLLGPLVLRLLWRRGSLATYRLSLVAFGINTLLLGFLAFMEASKLPPLELEELPTLHGLYPALSLLLPAGYLLAVLPTWARRWRLRGRVQAALQAPVDAEALEKVTAAMARARTASPGPGDDWAEFETVPVQPRAWKRYLRPDFERHGVWRVAFGSDWALVFKKDGSRAEAVPRPGLRTAADDPASGAPRVRCLLRWNAHLHEGRIRWPDLEKIQAWQTGARNLTVPLPY
jgi:hypothetical protein